MRESGFDYREVLGYRRQKTLCFSEFVEGFMGEPESYLHSSTTLIIEAIRHFGFRIVVRSGEPIISYKIFDDPFCNGINAVFGQEPCIKHIVDVIDSAAKETGPNRGIVLVGPPASGKTNIVDIIALALEEYTKHSEVKLYSFFFLFSDKETRRSVEIWSSFRHSPILLFPTILQKEHETRKPRQELLDSVNSKRKERGQKAILFPNFFQNASLDKCSMDILERLVHNPNHSSMSLYEILEKYVRVEEIVFSNAQAQGIANIDDMRLLNVITHPRDLGAADRAFLSQILPVDTLSQYEGAIVSSNRGLLHIHDAFGVSEAGKPPESEYKPLLLLLGSGKVSVDATQSSIDNTVLMTTNLEEMTLLERQLTSSKLLDRIEKIPVNYLLDANSEMGIFKRDMANIREKYEVDPNLMRIAAYYAVLTRLLPPGKKKFQHHWSEEKIALYSKIRVEQKLFIYANQSTDPISTIMNLPKWHPFFNEAHKHGFSIKEPETYEQFICKPKEAQNLYETGLFTNEELRLIDDDFMRTLIREHYPNEGKHGISVRQLQNVMRNTIARSDGAKVHVGTFLSQLNRVIAEGPELHHWLQIDPKYSENRQSCAPRQLSETYLVQGEGDYGDFVGLVKVVRALYFHIIKKEITISTVDRDPDQIERDLRFYLQNALLANALENKAFSHIMVPQFTFIHPRTGLKVDHPDIAYMVAMEGVLDPTKISADLREEMSHKFLRLQADGEIQLQKGKTIISSHGDRLVECFSEELNSLLSHRKNIEGIDINTLKKGFLAKKNGDAFYHKLNEETVGLIERIIENMIQRFSYPESIALDTIAFAIRKDIVNFEKILT